MIQQTLVSGLVIGLVVFGVWFYLINILHWEESIARNIVLMLMVLFQNMHAFNCRSEKTSTFKISLKRNLILLFGVLGAQLVQVLATHIPFMQEILQVHPISTREWIILLGLASSVLWVMEIFKLVIKKIEKKNINNGQTVDKN